LRLYRLSKVRQQFYWIESAARKIITEGLFEKGKIESP
jgi:hypothetical protein